MDTVFIDSNFITLGQFLKLINAISSGGEAKYFLKENVVEVNGIQETKRGRKLNSGDRVSLQGNLFIIENNNADFKC